MKKTDHPAKSRNLALLLFTAAAILIAGLLLWLSLLPYPALKGWLDRLAADGSLESFTNQAHRSFQILLRLLSVVLLGAGGFCLLAPRLVTSLLRGIGRQGRDLILAWPRDMAAAVRELPRRLLRRDVLVPMALLTLFAILARILYLNDPMYHDEAYSFVVFAKLPLRLAVADYHFPNNHLLNTLLTHLSQRIFGDEPWAVRLAAFSAGVVLVPAGYLLARQLYGRTTAWLAGAALAAAPVLVSYSTNSRGYSLMALFTVLVFVIAVDQTRRSNLFYWTLAAIFAALGFYAVPVFLMPFVLILTWLILCGLNPRVIRPKARAEWFARLVYFSGLSATITLLLYLPVFRYSGVGAVVANPYIESLSWQDFWPTLVSRLEDIGAEWTRQTPTVAVALAGLGVLLSLLLHRRISRQPVSTQLAALIAIPLILLAQRPNPWAKIWQFLFPLVLIWAAGGLAGGLSWLESRIKRNFPLEKAGIGLSVLALAGMAAVNALGDHPGLRSRVGPAEQAAVYLSTQLTAEDIVVIAPVEDAPLWYYFYKYDLSQEHFRRDVPFKRAFVVVSRKDGQNLDQVLQYRGPDRGFLRMETARRVAEMEGLEVYVIEADWDAVSKAYQLASP